MSNHFPASQWRSWIEACQQSDLTVGKFCESIGVSVNTYYRWRQRLKDDLVADDRLEAEFIPISMPVSLVEIEFPGGSTARIANDAKSLRPLVTLLLELGAEQ